MISRSHWRGIIRGKTIELAGDPGLQDGQEVEVTVRAATTGKAWGEGLRRAAGALSDSWQTEDDEILDRIQQARAQSGGRELPR